MARDLRQAGIALVGDAPVGRLLHAAGTHDQHPRGTEVDGRGDGRGLSHGAVTEPLGSTLALQLLGREHEGNGRRRKQMRQADAGGHRPALRARPGLHGLAGLVEGDVVTAGVAGGGDRQSPQVPLGQQVVQPLQGHGLGQQVGQWAVVEQGFGPRPPPARHQPAHAEHGQPLRTAADHPQRVSTVDLLGTEVLPHGAQVLHGTLGVIGPASQRRGIDGTG